MSVVVSLRDVYDQEVSGEELRTAFGAGPDAEAFAVRMSKLFSRTAGDLDLADGWSLYIAHPGLPQGERRYSQKETLALAGLELETS